MGLQARLMSQALRKLTASHQQDQTPVCIFINQLRDKIGVVYRQSGNDHRRQRTEILCSVSALDIRQSLPASRTVKSSSVARAKVKVVKNKVAPPFRRAEFDIMYGEGISQSSGEIVDLGVEFRRNQEKRLRGISYGESKLGQGRETVKQLVMDNPELAEELTQKIVEAMENGVQPTTK